MAIVTSSHLVTPLSFARCSGRPASGVAALAVIRLLIAIADEAAAVAADPDKPGRNDGGDYGILVPLDALPQESVCWRALRRSILNFGQSQVLAVLPDHANKTQRRMVSATIATVFAQDSADAAHQQWRAVADQLRTNLPRLGGFMDGAEHEVLSYISFHCEQWCRPLDQSAGAADAEIKRRTNVVGIASNDSAVTRLVSAMLL